MSTDDQVPLGSRISHSIMGHDVRIIDRGMVNGRLIAAARGLLGWDQQELSKRAGVKRQTVADMENDARRPQLRVRNAVMDSLENAGVRFIEVQSSVGAVIPRGDTTSSNEPLDQAHESGVPPTTAK